MNAAEVCGGGCMVGGGDWPDVDARGDERGIGSPRKRGSFVLPGGEDCREEDGIEAAGGSGDYLCSNYRI